MEKWILVCVSKYQILPTPLLKDGTKLLNYRTILKNELFLSECKRISTNSPSKFPLSIDRKTRFRKIFLLHIISLYKRQFLYDVWLLTKTHLFIKEHEPFENLSTCFPFIPNPFILQSTSTFQKSSMYQDCIIMFSKNIYSCLLLVQSF